LTNQLPAHGIVFSQNHALIAGSHGSSETQDFEDAAAHAQGRKPLAPAAVEQVPAMRQHSCIAQRLSIVRLL
jgi:hypothetical protein